METVAAHCNRPRERLNHQHLTGIERVLNTFPAPLRSLGGQRRFICQAADIRAAMLGLAFIFWA
jgi:hypothetical protein